MSYLLNTETGQILQADNRATRMARLGRRVHAWSDTLAKARTRQGQARLIMITLTLRPGVSWQPQMMRDFMLSFRKRLKGGLLAYAWVAEMQQRGAVHYHLLALVKRGTNVPYADKSGLWPWGSTKTETARSVWYICKYTSKGDNATPLPYRLRLFSVWIVPNVTNELERWEFRLSSCPKFIRDLLLDAYPLWKWKRGVGGYDISPPGDPEVITRIINPWKFILQ